MLSLFSRGATVPKSEISVDLMLRAGLFTNTHIIDVGYDNPENFRYEFYAPSATFSCGSALSTTVGDITWPLLRLYAAEEYHRIKTTGQPDFSQMDISNGGKHAVFRRLILPLSKGRDVSHLLVVFVTNLLEVVPSTLDQEIA